MRLDARRLQHDADALLESAFIETRVVAQDGDIAGGPVSMPLQDLDRSRLPGAVRAEESEHFAPGHTQVYAAHGLHVAVRLAQAAHLDGR